SDHNTLKGVKMIHDKLLQMLAKEEVEPIQAQEGDVIDNEEFVEAISAIEVEKKEQKGKIIQVIERGYIFRGKPLLRTKVIVGK
ncbi:MAG: nucleotide exchange factor GrpE, partial [Bacteroidota bacterium]